MEILSTCSRQNAIEEQTWLSSTHPAVKFVSIKMFRHHCAEASVSATDLGLYRLGVLCSVDVFTAPAIGAESI